MLGLGQVQLNDILSSSYAATKAEGKLLMQRAQNVLSNSRRHLWTRKKKPYLKDALNTLHSELNKFIDKYAELKFLQEFIVQLKFIRASVKRRISALA